MSNIKKPSDTVSPKKPVKEAFYRVIRKSLYEYQLQQVDVDPSTTEVKNIETPNIRTIVLKQLADKCEE